MMLLYSFLNVSQLEPDLALELHRGWLEHPNSQTYTKHEHVQADLSKQNLSNLIFRSCFPLQHVDLRDAILTRADFRHVDLRGVILNGPELIDIFRFDFCTVPVSLLPWLSSHPSFGRMFHTLTIVGD